MPNEDVNHQREQQALIPHGTVKFVMSLLWSYVKMFNKKQIYVEYWLGDREKNFLDALL